MFDVKSIESGHQDRDSDIMSITARRRRSFQRQACILSVMAAFSLGLALGIFVPLFGLASSSSAAATAASSSSSSASRSALPPTSASLSSSMSSLTTASLIADDLSRLGGERQIASSNVINLTLDDGQYLTANQNQHNLPHFPTIDDIREKDPLSKSGAGSNNPYASVTFIAEEKLKAEDVFRNAFHIDQRDDKMLIKKFDPADGSIKEYSVQRTQDGYFLKGTEKKISKPSIIDQALAPAKHGEAGSDEIIVDIVTKDMDEDADAEDDADEDLEGIVARNIYWGERIEKALPSGFRSNDTDDWSHFLESAEVDHLEMGCGRMQNRLVVFRDGTKACARYRQNTDQIQGELFSFYLGKLLNLSNLAPSAASIIDLNSKLWSTATQDISNSQWKSLRPVVLTKWVSDLEPAGIPKPFQPLERHLNKIDVKNITLGLDVPKPPKGLLDRLGATTKSSTDLEYELPSLKSPTTTSKIISDNTLSRLVELAQWSDLIVFDYLIANLDRVVNNLYNFQWNADIMAAPAHNLAKQSDTQLLVFLDNESGLLHGYRLLKKYEAYHGLLLDNLCIFRKPTIDALKALKSNGVGQRLNHLFELTTTLKIRDVLPPLPEKSIQILVDRIDRVLGQVQKCREIFSNR